MARVDGLTQSEQVVYVNQWSDENKTTSAIFICSSLIHIYFTLPAFYSPVFFAFSTISMITAWKNTAAAREINGDDKTGEKEVGISFYRENETKRRALLIIIN